MAISYKWIPGNLVAPELLSECAKLYSHHYGYWADCSPKSPGERIKLSSPRLREWFASKDANIYQARVNGELIGYAIAVTIKVPDYGLVSWVTQLVVHTDYRQQDVAKTLLFSIWGLSDHYAWGIVSANPYAVRALEKATRRRCVPARIVRNKRKLVSVGAHNVPYIAESTAVEVKDGCSRINTEFFVDHSQLHEMVGAVTSDDIPWLIGLLKDGWEWFAFTFRNQDPISLSAQEVEKMITASDQVTRHAYSRMLRSSAQAWMKHAEPEADLILKYCNLAAGSTILDFGCGTGRHSITLAKRGLTVFGVDYLPENIEIAQHNAGLLSGVTFITDDCRSVSLPIADAAICLYDVIGSHADNNENRKILGNIANHLRADGLALISVMNYEVTEFNAKYRFRFNDEPNRLLDLPASQIMENTGNVFDPDFYIVDTETQVVYRREQFLTGDSLPVELLVRDRRFHRFEIEEMCSIVGLDVVWSRYVSAGKWETGLDRYDRAAKEIILLCRKRAE